MLHLSWVAVIAATNVVLLRLLQAGRWLEHAVSSFTSISLFAYLLLNLDASLVHVNHIDV